MLITICKTTLLHSPEDYSQQPYIYFFLIFSSGAQMNRKCDLESIQEVPGQVLAKMNVSNDILEVSILFEC
jgi:hypothetical protein